MTHTDIHRTFFDLPNVDRGGAGQEEALLGLKPRGELTWNDLLNSKRILIVSAAGVGKTHECKQQQRKLFEAGYSAFFVELAVLATNPLEDQLFGEQGDRYALWKSAESEPAVFFLDSVDELKLTRRSFESTIRRFAAIIGNNIGRAKIVMTTRPIPFDLDVAQRWLPVPAERPEPVDADEEFASTALRIKKEVKQDKKAGPKWRSVGLSPLNEEQKLALAHANKVADPDALLAAIAGQNLQDFTGYPMDFIALCGDWKVHGRIRSYREQVSSNVDVRLRFRDEREEPTTLPAARAREGAERLALATILTRRFTIWYSDDGDLGRGDSALDPGRILGDWNPEEIKTLLQRSLFGFASYGRVRFHNRTATEFLAAARLAALGRSGMSPRVLNRLLFATTPVNNGWRVVKSSMQPVAAWLAVDNQQVFERVLSIEPSLLLSEADPGVLTAGQKSRALARYVDQYGRGGWRGKSVPALQIHRFATQELAAEVQRLWSDGIENPEVRETLLELIGAGRMSDCAGIARAAAINPAGDMGGRLRGLVALAELGDPGLASMLAEITMPGSAWPPRLVANATAYLYPKHMSITQLLGVLGRLSPNRREILGIASMLPKALAGSNPTRSDLNQLRAGLVDMLRQSVTWNGPNQALETSRTDLLPLLLSACRLELAMSRQEPVLMDAIVLALRLAHQDIHSEEESKLLRAILVEAGAELREAVFWANDRLMVGYVTNRSDPWPRLINFIHDGPFDIQRQKDLAWIHASLADKALQQEQRAMLLELAIRMAGAADDQVAEVQSLTALVADVARLADRVEEELKKLGEEEEKPDWLQRHELRQEEHRLKQQQDIEDWKAFSQDLKRDPHAAFAPECRHMTALNLWRVMGAAGHKLAASGWNRGFIERHFGAATADLFRDALRIEWRGIKPTTKSERPPDQRNTFILNWRMGLSGIYAEAEDAAWASGLDPQQAELAVRYALIDTDGLPAWMDDLIVEHRAIVERMIGKELQEELDDASPYSMLLQDIRRSSPLLIQLCLPRMREWLYGVVKAGGEELETDKAQQVCQLVLAQGGDVDIGSLKDLAVSSLAANPSQQVVMFWLPVLLLLDAQAAVDFMETRAEKVHPRLVSEVTEWFAELIGHSRGGTGERLGALSKEPSILRRMAELAYRHVRPSDDVEHEGVYSPGIRDNAQHARSILTNALLESKGVLAWQEKIAFAESPLIEDFRDRAIELARQGLEGDFDAPLMSEADVVDLDRAGDFIPKSRSELAQLLDDRLAGLQDLLHRDDSQRELWNKISLERELRRAVARELTISANGAYSVVQESVTGEENETDIRLATPSMEAVIELKLAESYSLKEFERALREQLVAKYLAPEHRRVGCLMISISKGRTWKRPGGGANLSFEELLEHLRNQAVQLVQSLGYGLHLYVEGLDMRVRAL